jgi:hypothetical protein
MDGDFNAFALMNILCMDGNFNVCPDEYSIQGNISIIRQAQ